MSNIASIETYKVGNGVKTHTCSWCAGTIEKNEPHFMYRFFENPNPEMKKAHADCMNAIEQAYNNHEITYMHKQSIYKRGHYCKDARNCECIVEEKAA